MSNIPSLFKEQAKRYYYQKKNGLLFYFNKNIEKNDLKKFIETNNIEKFPLLINYWYTECIQDDEEREKIETILNDYSEKVIMTQSTLSSGDNLSHPYTNILMWEDLPIRNNIANTKHHGVSRLWPKSLYYQKEFSTNEKKYNHILSVRRNTEHRDYVINRINLDKITIYRYYNITSEDESNFDVSNIEKYVRGWPLWPSLMNEYKKSYFSFVMETMMGDTFPFVPFSEKTLMSFITRTIPIVFAQKHVNKKLHELGFWTANYDFGYHEIEDLDSDDKKRMDKYIEIINKVTDMTDKQIHEYYFDNYKHIYGNWKLLMDIFKVGKTTI